MKQILSLLEIIFKTPVRIIFDKYVKLHYDIIHMSDGQIIPIF